MLCPFDKGNTSDIIEGNVQVDSRMEILPLESLLPSCFVLKFLDGVLSLPQGKGVGAQPETLFEEKQ